jgi:hypothetical protein
VDQPAGTASEAVITVFHRRLMGALINAIVMLVVLEEELSAMESLRTHRALTGKFKFV